MARPLRVVGSGIDIVVDRDASIGRDPACDIVLDSPLASRRHARLVAAGDGWTIEDDGSRNGLFLDGERVDRVAVDGAVRVCFGAVDGTELSFTPHAVEVAVGSASPELGKLTAIHVPGSRFRIGRDPDNDLVLDDLLVSRHHAELVRAGSAVELVDLDSANGTFVNGRRVDRAPVSEQDVISVGRRRLRLSAGRLEEYEDADDVAYQAAGLVVRTPSGDTLLDGVSFSLGSRSFLGVVGPSGAGKSTLLNALTGFRPAHEGRVVYGGRDLYAEYEELGQRIGLVPQDDILHPELTVGRALEFAAELRFPADVTAEERAARIDEVLAELGLTHRRDVPIHRLSGGQRKRTSVALELLTRPSLLFLDEPTSGLDPGYERSLMALLRTLADTGRTVVVVTHAVQSLRLCDRVLVLATGGRVAYFGPPQLAPAYFGCDDFEGVFQLLNEDPSSDWKGRFAAHPDHATYVAADAAKPPAVGAVPATASAETITQSFTRQVATLSRRYAAVLAADRRNLLTLLLQAPILGILLLATLPAGELGSLDGGRIRLLSQAGLVLFNLALGATWLGASNAAREIAKELPIFRRERSVGLSIGAYVTSKALVLGIITVAQAAVFVGLATARQNGPQGGVVIGWGVGELMLVTALTGLAGMALGLFLSSISSTADAATTLLPIVLIVQLTLAAGGLFPALIDKPVLQQVSYASSAQWGFAAAASTVSLNQLQPVNVVARELPQIDVRDPAPLLRAMTEPTRGDGRFRHAPRAWWTNVAALVALTALGLLGAAIALRRLDPGVPS